EAGMARWALARLKERYDGAHTTVVVVSFRHLQLHQDAVYVLFDGPFGDPELAGDAGVGAALGHEREHFTLPGGQRLKRVVAVPGGDEFLDETGIDDGASARDPPERVDELVYVGDAILEEVADALPAGEQLHRVLDLGMGRQDEDARLRELGPDNPRCLQALGRVARRHPDIDDSQVGLALAHQLDDLGGGARLAHELEAGVLQQARDPLPEEDVVVGQHHTRLRHRRSRRNLGIGSSRCLRYRAPGGAPGRSLNDDLAARPPGWRLRWPASRPVTVGRRPPGRACSSYSKPRPRCGGWRLRSHGGPRPARRSPPSLARWRSCSASTLPPCSGSSRTEPWPSPAGGACPAWTSRSAPS